MVDSDNVEIRYSLWLMTETVSGCFFLNTVIFLQ